MATFKALTLLALALHALAWQVEAKAKLTPTLQTLLRSRQRLNVLVTMKDTPSSLLNDFISVNSHDRGRRISAMVEHLQERAKVSQRNVLNMLSFRRTAAPVSYETLWASNQLILRGATPEILKQIEAMDEVLEITEEQFITLEPVTESKSYVLSPSSDEPQWGIKKVAAPEAWMKGIDGKGIIVGIIDTGARGTHECLKQSYVGKENYGWFDPVTRSEEPYDNVGHGTHVTATTVGTHGVGVAPGAKWMCCKGCSDNSCSNLDLGACMQFMACPTNTSGGSPNCSKAPHVVSNSWGGPQGNTYYRRFIDTLRAAGIVVVYSAGNSGPFCSSMSSPGDGDNVIAVGAIDSNNRVASFSSAGPTMDGRVKPDIVAPGQNILSASNESDSGYVTYSGTSMACPHAAGVVALILSKNPNLSPDQVQFLLNTSTNPVSGLGLHCGGRMESRYPNNHAGYGCVNATKALNGLN